MNTRNNDEKVPLIRYPRFKELHEEIRLCQRMTKITGEPQCISLEGMPGAGKSTLVTDYVSNFPRQETKDGSVIPIFYTVTPSPVTVKGMASHMLKKMGDPAADKGTLTSMNSRLIGLIVDCGVELVILDDFHHLIDSETNRILSSVSDWLKVLIKETNIPYMVIGVENTIEMILDTNKQLSRLFASRLDLEPFKWDPANQATIQEFDRFIHYVEQARLPLDKSLSRLELLYRIHYATNGVMSNMMNLLNLAAVFASDRGREKISPDQLALAFDKRLAEHVENKINPFTQDWDIRFTSPVS